MIFRTPLSNGRYSSQTGAISSLFTLRFQDLEPDEISDIMGIKEEWSTLRRIVDDIYKSMKPPRDLASFISAYKEIKNEDASKISGRIRILTKISSIFSDSTSESLSTEPRLFVWQRKT